MIYRAIVYGSAGVQGSTCSFPHPQTGRMVTINASQGEGKGKNWRQDMIKDMMNDHPETPIDDAAYILIRIYVSRPKSDYKKDWSLKPNAPKYPKSGRDWDKVGRSVSDASQIANIVKNDARFADAHVQRRFTSELMEPERVEVFIYNMEELGENFLDKVLARVSDGYPIADELVPA